MPQRFNAKQMGEKLATTISLTLGLEKRHTKPELVLRYFDIALKEANPQWRSQLKKAIDEIRSSIRLPGKRSPHSEHPQSEPDVRHRPKPRKSSPFDETQDFEQ